MSQQESALQTFCRRLEILHFLRQSRQPRSVTEIVNHLDELDLLEADAAKARHDGSKTQMRKIQRDLQFLAGDATPATKGEDNFNEFGLSCKPGGRRSILWSIDQTIDTDFNWATMPDHMAVTLALAEKHLTTIMPSRYHQMLSKHYQAARQKITQSSRKFQPKQLENLLNRVVIDQRGLRLEAAQVNEDLLDTIYEALILNRRLRICYKGRWATIHPHGVVLARPKMYLLALKNDDDHITQLRSYLIHRIEEISLLAQTARQLPDFRLSEYLADGMMEIAIDQDHAVYDLVIKLQPDAGSNLIQDLRETPVAVHQDLIELQDGSYQLLLRIRRTYQMLNWIINLGPAATVMAPACIREDVIRQTANIMANYQA